jgi:hypothetical protein
MKKTVLKLGAIFVALALAGCETTEERVAGARQGVDVTRSFTDSQIARGEIRVEPANPAQGDPGFSDLAAPVARELARLGWTVTAANARSEQIAFVQVNHGGQGPGNSIVGELEVRIQRRSDGSVPWTGRARLEARARSPLADRRAAVDRLATALFQDFPGESGRTIRVR